MKSLTVLSLLALSGAQVGDLDKRAQIIVVPLGGAPLGYVDVHGKWQTGYVASPFKFEATGQGVVPSSCGLNGTTGFFDCSLDNPSPLQIDENRKLGVQGEFVWSADDVPGYRQDRSLKLGRSRNVQVELVVNAKIPTIHTE